jgi:hypothetical protein
MLGFSDVFIGFDYRVFAVWTHFHGYGMFFRQLHESLRCLEQTVSAIIAQSVHEGCKLPLESLPSLFQSAAFQQISTAMNQLPLLGLGEGFYQGGQGMDLFAHAAILHARLAFFRHHPLDPIPLFVRDPLYCLQSIGRIMLISRQASGLGRRGEKQMGFPPPELGYPLGDGMGGRIGKYPQAFWIYRAIDLAVSPARSLKNSS